MARLAMYTGEPFYIVKGEFKTTRSRYDTLALMCEPFDEIFYYTMHVDGNPENLELYRIPEKYICVSVGNWFEKSKIRRMMRMLMALVSFPFQVRHCDIIYSRLPMWDAYIPALMAVLFLRKRFISLHGDMEESLEIALRHKPAILRKLFVRLMGSVTRFIARNAHVLFVSGPAIGRKCAPGHNNVVSFLDSGFTSSDIVRRDFVCETSPVRLLYVGELSERKGISYLLQALQILKNKKRDVVLKLVGAGNLGRYVSESKNLGISDIVTFVGHVPYGPGLFAVYRNSDIMILPSIGTEGWSRVIVEANANGVPIVTTEVGSLGYAARECECGLVAKTADAASIAQCVERIIDDPQLRKKMLRGARKRAELHCVEKELSQVWTALYVTFPEFLKPAPQETEWLRPMRHLG